MIRTLAAALATTTCIVALAAPAAAQTREFNIPAGSLRSALDAFARQSGRQVIYRGDEVRSARSPGVRGARTADDALDAILAGTGFTAKKDASGAFAVAKLGNAPAAAETAASSRNTGDAGGSTEIVVTGTNLRGLVGSSSPTISVNRQQIQESGATDLPAFFRKIPQNFSGGANPEDTVRSTLTGNTNRYFGSGVNVHGLGTGTTLTLINGKRITSSDATPFVDISMIPLAAIDRIDILTDGASAIYGSDAVGGVVNLILRRDFKGIELGATSSLATAGDYTETKLNAAAGASWQSGGLLATYEYNRNSNLDASNRSFSRNTPLTPYDLIPSGERHSALVSAHLEPADTVSISADGFYSHRETVFTSTASDFAGGSYLQLSNVAVEQYGATGQVQFDPTPAWRIRGIAGYSENNVSATTEQISGTDVSRFPDFANSRLTSAELIADGSLISLPGGEINVALGGSYRHESYRDVDLSGDRSVSAVFGEISVPIFSEQNRVSGIEALSFTAAGRYDHYSDFGSTVNPKLGLRWQPLSNVTLRGSYGKSFRAPNFTQLSPAGNQTILVSLPDPSSTTGHTITLVAIGGNPSLKPERATNWTVGAEFETPSKRTRLSIDFYDIAYSGRIAQASNNIPALFLQGTTLDSIITRNPTAPAVQALVDQSAAGFGLTIVGVGPFAVPPGTTIASSQAIVDLRLSNISQTTQRGLDIVGSQAFEGNWGALKLDASANIVLKSSRKVTPTSPSVSILDTVYNVPDFRGRITGTYEKGAFRASVSANYTDGYTDDLTEGRPAVSSWTTFDLWLGYDFKLAATPAKSLSLSASIQNIFNRNPPFVNDFRGLGYDPNNATPRGRFISIDARVRF